VKPARSIGRVSRDSPVPRVPLERVIDLTPHLNTDGTLDANPGGKWTLLRLVSRNNGAPPAGPDPGIGFECDKFDAAALDAILPRMLANRAEGGTPSSGRSWTMLLIDSWEMGAQNWTPKWREEFRKRRGYDPQAFYPCISAMLSAAASRASASLGTCVGLDRNCDREPCEHLKRIGRKHGFTLSIEPYDMNPTCDFDLGAVADVPMCEFWSLGFDTAYSCHTASSIAHVIGRPVVAAEAFTADHREAWRFHPGYLKNQGDWAFATGINRLTYHTFAHKPDEGRPGMVMGPYACNGIVARREAIVGGITYTMPAASTSCGRLAIATVESVAEGAPNVFQPPASALPAAIECPTGVDTT